MSHLCVMLCVFTDIIIGVFGSWCNFVLSLQAMTSSVQEADHKVSTTEDVILCIHGIIACCLLFYIDAFLVCNISYSVDSIKKGYLK